MACIWIEDLIGSVFAIYLSKTGKRRLTMSSIEKFGHMVIEELKEQGIDACLCISREDMQGFFYLYSNLFTYDENIERGFTVILKNSVTSDQLHSQFSTCFSTEMYIAFFCDDKKVEMLIAKNK